MTKSYDVLYISYDGLTDPLGRSQIEPYIRGLAKRGFGIVLMTFEKKGVGTASQIRRIKDELKAIGVKWMPMRYHKYPPTISTLLDTISGFFAAFFITISKKIKVVHARSYVSSIIALALKRIFKVKFIFDIRGFYIDERVEAGVWEEKSLLCRVLRKLEKIFFKNADSIISLTDAARVEICKFPFMSNKDTPIDVVPTCVDIDMFRSPKAVDMGPSIKHELKDKTVLIYSGSLELWRTLDDMFDFFQVAALDMPNLRFLFITKEKDFLQRKLDGRSGAWKDLIVTTSADYHSMPEYLSLGSAGIAFYNEEFSKKACCPTKLGEYLASGFPIIVRAGLGDTEKIITDERVGVVVKDFSRQAYKDAACELNRLFTQGESLKKRCMETADKYFSLAKGVETYSKVYENLIR